MRIAITAWQGRVSPVLDCARRVLVVDIEDGRERGRREHVVRSLDPWARARELLELGPDVLICGAISAPLENALALSGVRIYAFVCGPVEGVLAAYLDGTVSSPRFAMPGASHGPWRRGRLGRIPMPADMQGGQGPGGHGRGGPGGCGGARRGRRGGPGGGAPATCVCPNCGEKAPHVPGTPCRQIPCPKCGTPMIRG